MIRLDHKIIPLVLYIGLTFGMAGCASLKAVRVIPGHDTQKNGMPYNLTFTQFDITVTRTLIKCTNNNAGALLVLTEAEVKETEKADPSRRYVIDTDALQRFASTSSLEVKYHDNNALKSINASSENLAVETVATMVTTLGKLAIATTSSAASPTAPPSGCSKSAQQYVNERKSLTEDVESLSSEITRMSQRLTLWNNATIALGARWTQDEREEYLNLAKAIQAKRETLEDKQQSLSKTVAALTQVSKITWPENGTVFETGSSIIQPLSNEYWEGENAKWGAVKDSTKFLDDLEVYAFIRPIDNLGRGDSCSPNCIEDDDEGLKYRMPAQGSIMLCTKKDCKDIIAKKTLPISQLGEVRTFGFNETLFGKQKVSGEFDSGMRPQQLGITNESSDGVNSATLIDKLVDAGIAVREAKKKNEKTPLDKLNEETTLLKAQADNAAAKIAIEELPYQAVIDETNAVQADTALIEAKIALIEAQKALAGVPGGN